MRALITIRMEALLPLGASADPEAYVRTQVSRVLERKPFWPGLEIVEHRVEVQE